MLISLKYLALVALCSRATFSNKLDLCIRVQDTGIGIPKEQQENIFNIFEQTENQDVKKYGGTGLGLSISRKLSEMMQGSLNVESEPGVGSTFIVRLNNIDIASLSDDEDLDEVKIDYASIVFKDSVLLVVDDIEENRNLVIETMRDTNIKILEAVNGKEAIDIAKNEKIDLILMDIRMPVLDGYAATRMIKDFSSVPIVALTASIMQEELDKLEGERFNGYLRKPVSKNELYHELIKYLDYEMDTPEVVVKEDNVIVPDTKNLDLFLKALVPNIEELYTQARTTNDMSKITEFVRELQALALKYEIEYISKYCELLLEEIDAFEIDTINMMLDSYKDKLKTLESFL